MKKRVLIVEQHIRRSVDANALIAAYLEEMGIKTRLSLTGSQLCRNLIDFEPHVVYYPWVTPYVYRFLRERQPTVPIVNAFQEQNRVLHQSDAPMVKWAGKSDYIFAWGDAHKRKFEDLFEKPTTIKTGNPRFDAYFDESIYEILYPSRTDLSVQYGLPPEKDWVLVALDFPLLFQPRARLDELIERGDLAEKQLELAQSTYKVLCNWITRLASDRHSSVLIVRPHPGSDLEQIRDDFGGENNSIRFIKGGGLPPWIVTADRYITRASTSVVESWLSDTPSALIRRDEHVKELDARPHVTEARTSLNSYSEFYDFVVNGGVDESRNQHYEFLASLHCLDGCSAHRTAQKLNKIASKQKEKLEYSRVLNEDTLEVIKFHAKKVINKYGLNKVNPLERPNKEFMSIKESRRKVSNIINKINN